MDNLNDTEETQKVLRLPLFQGYGLELEYMIVDRNTLNVLPITDKVIYQISKSFENEISRGEISWSNELALHVIEFKTTGPVSSLENLDESFLENVREVNQILAQYNGMLMPTAMHPWMDPFKEMRLWPHEHNPVYESFHRIFDCRGHGWSNLQCSHINLPFANDEEFEKLHAAIRILLPIMPAIAASSPIMENRLTGYLDSRLNVYQSNAKAIPSITGKVIPEVSVSRIDYEQNILQPMYRDIAPYDKERILQYEWLNSRGAIARFDRYTIEIRVLDIQECPAADLAVSYLIVGVLKALTAENWVSIDQLNKIDIDDLHLLFLRCVKEGENAVITNQDYLKCFGMNQQKCTVKELWNYLNEELTIGKNLSSGIQQAVKVILEKGSLARRIVKAWEEDPTKNHLQEIYRKLCACLTEGKLFEST